MNTTDRDWSAILGQDFSIKSPTLDSAGEAIGGAGKVAGSNIPYMAIANQVMTDIEDYIKLSDNSNVLGYTNQLNGMNRALWNADFGSSEDILQAHRFNNPFNISYVDGHRSANQQLATLGKDTASGAALGTSIFPGIGTAIGAIAGFVGGAAKNAFSDIKEDQNLVSANRALKKTILGEKNAIKYGVDAYNTKNNMLEAFNYSDMGGPLNHGTHWNDNIILVDAGGTHEANPYGGVLMGMDEQGTPNLVEEGETIYNDYVYSNRLKVPRGLRNKYKFGGKKPMSYSEFIKESPFFKAIEEMPNDPNVRRSFESFLGELAMSQEEVRAKSEMRSQTQRANKFEDGGKYVNGVYQGPWTWASLAQALRGYNGSMGGSSLSDYSYAIDKGFDFGEYKNAAGLEKREGYKGFWDKLIADIEAGDKDALEYLHALDDKTGNKKSNFFEADGKTLRANGVWKQRLNTLAFDKIMGANHLTANLNDFIVPTAQQEAAVPATTGGTAVIQGVNPAIVLGRDFTGNFASPITPIEPAKAKTKRKTDLTPLRYAPIAGNVAAWFDMLANPIDYSNIERYENYAMGLPMATTHPIGNYTEYRPFDINYATNRARAQSGGRERLIADLSGGNSAAARASLVANGFNEQNTVGDLLLAGAESNLKQRQFRDTFNRETDKYNSEDAFRTQNANIGIWNTKLNALVRGAAEREALDARYSAAKSANKTALAENLGNLGREEFIFNQLDNPMFLYNYLNRKGNIGYVGSKGGLLTVKKCGRK